MPFLTKRKPGNDTIQHAEKSAALREILPKEQRLQAGRIRMVCNRYFHRREPRAKLMIDSILLVDDEDLFHLVFEDACSLLDIALSLNAKVNFVLRILMY